MPQWAIRIGRFAQKRIRGVLEDNLLDSALARSVRAGRVRHPSPASPLANRGWAEAAEKQLAQLGVPVIGCSTGLQKPPVQPILWTGAQAHGPAPLGQSLTVYREPRR